MPLAAGEARLQVLPVRWKKTEDWHYCYCFLQVFLPVQMRSPSMLEEPRKPAAKQAYVRDDYHVNLCMLAPCGIRRQLSLRCWGQESDKPHNSLVG